MKAKRQSANTFLTAPLAQTLGSCFLFLLLAGCDAPAGKPSPSGDSLFARGDTVTGVTTADTAGRQTNAVTDRFDSIRSVVREMNAVTNWAITTRQDLEESTEGGEVSFYSLNGRVQKMKARRYGETYQQVTEYYLSDGNLLFVLDTTFQYNRPMYYDSTAMKDAGDTEAFDFDKSTVIIDSVYFAEGKIVKRSTRQQGVPSKDTDYLRRNEKELLQEVAKLMRLTK